MEDFVSTRASHTKENYISVNYKISKRKTKSTDGLINKQKLQKNDVIDSAIKRNSIDLKREQEKEMKKARYDVIKFGISGFEKGKAKKTQVDLAISLGAVQRKNRGMNYKKLKVRQKIDKKKTKKEEHISGLINSLIKPKLKKVNEKDSGILGVYGKISKNILSKQKS